MPPILRALDMRTADATQRVKSVRRGALIRGEADPTATAEARKVVREIYDLADDLVEAGSLTSGNAAAAHGFARGLEAVLDHSAPVVRPLRYLWTPVTPALGGLWRIDQDGFSSHPEFKEGRFEHRYRPPMKTTFVRYIPSEEVDGSSRSLAMAEQLPLDHEREAWLTGPELHALGLRSDGSGTDRPGYGHDFVAVDEGPGDHVYAKRIPKKALIARLDATDPERWIRLSSGEMDILDLTRDPDLSLNGVYGVSQNPDFSRRAFAYGAFDSEPGPFTESWMVRRTTPDEREHLYGGIPAGSPQAVI